MKLGLLGGTFDPIHLGHLRAAENVRESLGLDRVVFVPARLPPHRAEPAATPLDRYAMVALATSSHPAFVPSDVEVRRDGPSYTVDTVSALRSAHPGATVVLIIGHDNLALVPEWRDPERLFGMCELAVVTRPGAAEGASTGRPPRTAVHHVEGPGLPIASRDIRECVRSGRSVRYLVADGVAEYIEKRGLYR